LLNGYSVDKGQPSEVKIIRNELSPDQNDDTNVKSENENSNDKLKAFAKINMNQQMLSGVYRRNYNSLSHQDRKEMKADEVLALYLYRLSNRINADYWRTTALPFVMLFRECLNEYGWAKKIETESINLENDPKLRYQVDNDQFCLFNGCEAAPEICNEFVTVYMEGKQALWNELRRQ
jgi:hypothetical protein